MVKYAQMEKRRSGRLPISIDAKIVSGGIMYKGLIKDISECGMGYLMTSLSRASKDFTPEKVIVLIFKTPSGETLNLNCEVKWFLRASPADKMLTLGMKIIDLDSEYKEYLKTLCSDN